MMTHVTAQQYFDQANNLFELLRAEEKLQGVKIVHFNFMARGDAMTNPHFVTHIDILVRGLDRLAQDHHLEAKFKISTIFPRSNLFGDHSRDLGKWVKRALDLHPGIEFYYSLYSLDKWFRKKWIPKATDPDLIGEIFRGRDSGFRLHHALIEHENDSIDDMDHILAWLEEHKITCRINIVRYNPHNPSCGREPREEYIEVYKKYMEQNPHVSGVNVVSRVGFDVAASCGMFIQV